MFLSVFICCSVLDLFICLLSIAIYFCAFVVTQWFVLSVLNIIHILDLESVCLDSKHLYYVLCSIYSISYLLVLWIQGT